MKVAWPAPFSVTVATGLASTHERHRPRRRPRRRRLLGHRRRERHRLAEHRGFADEPHTVVVAAGFTVCVSVGDVLAV